MHTNGVGIKQKDIKMDMDFEANWFIKTLRS